MIIYGAGMAGLLAAHMLRRFEPTVMEAQLSLPNNHDALLRFRSDAVSRATGIPFQKVVVQKAICYRRKLYEKSNIRFSNMYSAKVTGEVLSRSIINLEPGERFIAPPDFISQMARSVNIQYGKVLTQLLYKSEHPDISTIPMPVLMDMVAWPDKPIFDYKEIVSISCIIDGVELYQTLYYPDAGEMPYRASITGNKLIIEITGDYWQNNVEEIDNINCQLIDRCLSDFGIYKREYCAVSMSTQKYGKILPISNDVRKQFILALTDLYNMYSVGRFGTWRQILLDDVVRDVSLIERMISERSSYTRKLQLASA